MAGGDDKRKDIHSAGIPVLCRACEARHKGVCGALTEDQLVRLSRSTTRKAVSKETPLTSAGEDVTQFSNILGGVVKLSKLLPDGRQQIVGLQFAPDFIGRPFSEQSDLTTEAATTLRICSFPKSALEKMIEEAPDLEHRLHNQALRELDEARDWLLSLGRRSAREKLASFLCLIADHIDPEGSEDTNGIHSAQFELPLKRTDIADFLGLTPETVSRRLTEMRKEGLVEVTQNRYIRIPDIDALRDATSSDG
ncbi:Crp/Fnr family transcriptional regulator [Algicella marina]|uniref:Helix-turn-helix domain-containing protein n=1 Tax=Algicella marina TaxID=2683284 RepID=A0A6P1T644_9RHOB|nr:Crp/Fnr family transcriptional regulator [Algicella marina]QHQ36946.1 helix-turn-helix domain-containing protein [Algicella marina]